MKNRSRIAAAAGVLATSTALDNGQGRVPAMGFSSWNAVAADVNSTWMRDIVSLLQTSGLAAKGYRYVNVDEGWLKAHDENGKIVEDTTKFPEGMKAFGEWVTSQDRGNGTGTFSYGLYSCRGTCQCSEPDYHGPGSQGFEAGDVDWMINYANASYLKIDSCCGSQDHAVAIGQYSLWRDLLNATGKPVHFSLCGWEEWYAPPDPSIGYGGGASVGNQFRIAGDGDTWRALQNCANIAARMNTYAGPGGFNDPDLLIGPNGRADGTYATELQARSQVNLWSVIAAPLIISDNLLEASEYHMDTYGNEEVIAVNQDPLGIPGSRLAGADLSFPCTSPPDDVPFGVFAMPCNMSDPTQVWTAGGNATGAAVTLAARYGGADVYLANYGCGASDGAQVYGLASPQQACGASGSLWTFGNGTLTSAPGKGSLCLQAHGYHGPHVEANWCNTQNQDSLWTFLPDGRVRLDVPQSAQWTAKCLTPRPAATTCTNTWARPLHDGSHALIFVNNDGARNLTVACDEACFSRLGLDAASAPRGVTIRDLWAHATVATLAPPFSFSATVQGTGGSNIYRAIPN